MRISPSASRLAGIALVAFASVASAQTVRRGTVVVSVHDSTGAVIPNAELTLTKGLKDVLARGRTNDAGEATLPFEVSDSTELQVTMRKLGYPRTDHFFDGAPDGHNWLAITVPALKGTALAPVKVTAQADLRRKSYYLDADDIENADGYLDNGWDVVKRLRPDMLTSRGGCSTGVQQIWVNGKWIRLPLPPTGIAASRARVGVPPRARFSYAAVSVLSDISPEHIQEIIYHDCLENVTNVGAVNAIMVILKPGVVYQENVGSFVDDVPAKPVDPKK
jgi:hypothetical protein